ncbi:protein NPG1-like [Phoenix dactylifera]|uniref:Protein NPG1-like n=1 Tax=Phoenix dactylifera TaxID=42345 RepID=A0A8B8J0I2_PHODC|nr:protein NPG1-like [Phoenix dactylifera]
MGFDGDGDGGEGDGMSSVRDVSINGLTMKTAEVEAKLDEGNIQDAESSLREGLSLNYEYRGTKFGHLRGKFIPNILSVIVDK